MSNPFDEFDTAGGNPFDEFDAPVQAPQPRKVSEADVSTLPKTWDVDIGGQTLRGTFDPKAKAYTLPAADGGTLYIAKGADGLSLKRLRGAPLPKVAQGVIGVAQGVSDVANAGARAVEGGARLLDRGMQAVGINPYGVLDTIPQRLGMAGGAEEAIANQAKGYEETTGNSGIAQAGRIGGQILATLPTAKIRAAEGVGSVVGMASKPMANRVATGATGRFIDGAVQGAAGAALTASSQRDIPLEDQMGLGAVVGGTASMALPPAIRALGQGISGMMGAITRRLSPAEAEDMATTINLSLKQAGIEPGNMSREVQKRLADYINSGADDLSPDALRRIAQAQSLRVPVNLTRGAATRDFSQQQAESLLEGMPEGGALRDLSAANNRAIQQNMEGVAAAQRPNAVTKYQIGESVRGAARSAEDASWRSVGEAYERARATGRQLMIDPAPVVDSINRNIDAINAGNDSGPIMQMANALQRFGVIKKGADGLFEPTGNQMMGDQLMQLYQAANKSFKPGTVSAIHIGDFKRGILSALDTVGDAGPEYRQAIASMRRHAGQFDDPKAVANLLKMTSDTDPMIASERIFDRAVVNASIDDVGRLTRMLTTSDKSVRRDATQAVRNMRAGMVNYLLNEGFVGQQTNELGERVISGTNLQNAISKLGGGDLATGWQKVDALMGRKHTGELKKIIGTAYDATSKVPIAGKSSGTAERILSALGRLPMLGGPAESAVRMTIEGMKKQGQKKAARTAADAVGLLEGPIAERQKAEIGRRIGGPSALFIPALNQPPRE